MTDTLQILTALLPGAISALLGYLPLAYFAGRYGIRLTRRPLLAGAGYAIFLTALWIAVLVAGFAVTHELIPAFRGHGGVLAFIPPYVVLSLPCALILFVWFISKVRKESAH